MEACVSKNILFIYLMKEEVIFRVRILYSNFIMCVYFNFFNKFISY